MRYVVGGGLVIVGGLVVFGALTGRFAAMVAAVFKPEDLIDKNAAYIRDNGGAIAGTGSTPDVPPPADVLNPPSKNLM